MNFRFHDINPQFLIGTVNSKCWNRGDEMQKKKNGKAGIIGKNMLIDVEDQVKTTLKNISDEAK